MNIYMKDSWFILGNEIKRNEVALHNYAGRSQFTEHRVLRKIF